MRTKITLKEFLYSMYQDEDAHITLVDYNADFLNNRIITAWKSELAHTQEYANHKDWYVQDFVLTKGGLEIVITQFEPED